MAEITVVNPKTGERLRMTDDGRVIDDDGDVIKKTRNAKEAIRWLVENKNEIEIEKDNETTS